MFGGVGSPEIWGDYGPLALVRFTQVFLGSCHGDGQLSCDSQVHDFVRWASSPKADWCPGFQEWGMPRSFIAVGDAATKLYRATECCQDSH